MREFGPNMKALLLAAGLFLFFWIVISSLIPNPSETRPKPMTNSGGIWDEEVTGSSPGYPDDSREYDTGYEWASRLDIADPRDCRGNSDAFIEGCEDYTYDSANSCADEGDYGDFGTGETGYL